MNTRRRGDRHRGAQAAAQAHSNQASGSRSHRERDRGNRDGSHDLTKSSHEREIGQQNQAMEGDGKKPGVFSRGFKALGKLFKGGRNDNNTRS